jgi:hypothetical protein
MNRSEKDPTSQLDLKKLMELPQINAKDVERDDRLDVDLMFMTHAQVGRKREGLFNMKI